MGRRVVQLVTTDERIRAFQRMIMSKQGVIKKGDISKWFNIALDSLIRVDKQQQQHTTCNMHAMSKDEEMVSTLTELMKAIKADLWNDSTNPIDISCGHICHEKVLKNTISKLRGHDSRTTKKWIERLLKFEFIRKAPNKQYRILNDGHQSLDTKQELTEQELTEQKQKQREFDSTIEGLK